MNEGKELQQRGKVVVCDTTQVLPARPAVAALDGDLNPLKMAPLNKEMEILELELRAKAIRALMKQHEPDSIE